MSVFCQNYSNFFIKQVFPDFFGHFFKKKASWKRLRLFFKKKEGKELNYSLLQAYITKKGHSEVSDKPYRGDSGSQEKGSGKQRGI